jgi:hypothetical protein
VDLFAQEFKSEDPLRRVVADLFRKMGHVGVRIPHGPNEKGKDIIFYRSGPLDEKRLFACVVKNDPITGQADDHVTGAPAILRSINRGVINQIQMAFSEPLPNAKGTDEWVDCVYVISPYDCSSSAIDSVKTALQRSGQITFVCGQVLLELFAKYWPEFLWFESTVLVSYLSTLRKDIEADHALANLILQKSAYLESSPTSPFDLYVAPTLYRELHGYSLAAPELLTVRLPTGPRYLSEIREEVNSARRIDQLLDAAGPAIGCHTDLLSIAGEMLSFGKLATEALLFCCGSEQPGRTPSLQKASRRPRRSLLPPSLRPLRAKSMSN